MKILVTGAAGYIGAAVSHTLAARGHHVVGLAHSTRSEKAVLAKLTERMALPDDVVLRITEDAREDGAVSLPGSSLQTIPPPPRDVG